MKMPEFPTSVSHGHYLAVFDKRSHCSKLQKAPLGIFLEFQKLARESVRRAGGRLKTRRRQEDTSRCSVLCVGTPWERVSRVKEARARWRYRPALVSDFGGREGVRSRDVHFLRLMP